MHCTDETSSMQFGDGGAARGWKAALEMCCVVLRIDVWWRIVSDTRR